MHDTTAVVSPQHRPLVSRSGNPRYPALRRRYPHVTYLRRRARARVPHFAFEYADGGAGNDGGVKRNWAALDAVELVPRYGVMPALPPCDVELFGRHYSAPSESHRWAGRRLSGRVPTPILPELRSERAFHTR